MFYVFTRTWWRVNRDWPNGLEPHPGKRRYLKHVNPVSTEREAQTICAVYNATHDPGRLSRKAEYESR